jgi:hypothetical protein
VTSSLSAVCVFILCCSILVLPVHPRTRSRIAASTDCKHKLLCQCLESLSGNFDRRKNSNYILKVDLRKSIDLTSGGIHCITAKATF